MQKLDSINTWEMIPAWGDLWNAHRRLPTRQSTKARKVFGRRAQIGIRQKTRIAPKLYFRSCNNPSPPKESYNFPVLLKEPLLQFTGGRSFWFIPVLAWRLEHTCFSTMIKVFFCTWKWGFSLFTQKLEFRSGSRDSFTLTMRLSGTGRSEVLKPRGHVPYWDKCTNTSATLSQSGRHLLREIPLHKWVKQIHFRKQRLTLKAIHRFSKSIVCVFCLWGIKVASESGLISCWTIAQKEEHVGFVNVSNFVRRLSVDVPFPVSYTAQDGKNIDFCSQ